MKKKKKVKSSNSPPAAESSTAVTTTAVAPVTSTGQSAGADLVEKILESPATVPVLVAVASAAGGVGSA